jgi:hypothetical protein
MRITYHGGKLYISLTKVEVQDVKDNEGRPCEIDIGHVPMLIDDVFKIAKEYIADLSKKQ